MEIVVAAFYCFKNIDDIINLKDKLIVLCNENNMKGTILIAPEGINSTISGTKLAIDKLKNFLLNNGFGSMEYKESIADNYPFKKMKIRIKKEIVTIQDSLDVENMKGKYVTPDKWDEFISSDDVILIDTRNDYEVLEGTFEGAINPHTKSFSEIKDWLKDNCGLFKGKKLAMTCTGGIRCEKSTAYVRQALGHNEVYHLKGGILQYLKDTNNTNGKWQGKCFVFDERFAVDEQTV